ncbi:MAG: phage holin family protein [Patescibacteria group bacterium]
MFKHLLVGTILNAIALYAITVFLPEITYTGSWKFLLIGGAFMGLMNTFVKPFLKILALPFIFLSAGLFIIVINAGLLWALKYFLDIAKFQEVALVIPTKGSYLLAALVFGVVNLILHIFIKNKE